MCGSKLAFDWVCPEEMFALSASSLIFVAIMCMGQSTCRTSATCPSNDTKQDVRTFSFLPLFFTSDFLVVFSGHLFFFYF